MRTVRTLKKILYGVVTLFLIGSLVIYIGLSRNPYVGISDAPEEMYIYGGMLFDGVDGEAIPNLGILLKDGVIFCIGRSCEASTKAISIDATGLSILPGLIELHGHFFAQTKENAELSIPAFIWNTAQAKPDVRRKLLEAGVTSFRSVGDPRDAILSIKTSLENGELGGPRLLVAGPIFTAPGGHPAIRGQDPNIGGIGGLMTFQSDDVSAVQNEAETLASQGVDGFKAVLHGVVSGDGEVALPTLSLATLSAIAEVAKSNNFWLAVHVGQTSQHVIDAVNAGASSIEHGVRGGNLINEEALELLVNNKVVYVPTLGREPLGHLNIAALYDAGVIIGVGTDTNNPEMSFGDSYHIELSSLVDAGLPPNEALLAATKNGAYALRKSDHIGTIEEGKFADLILVEGAPWEDITELRNVVITIQAGHIVVNTR